MATALFVCLAQRGRSQMIAALFERAAAGATGRSRPAARPTRKGACTRRSSRSCASSASTSPTARPQRLTTELAEQADVVVTMGCPLNVEGPGHRRPGPL